MADSWPTLTKDTEYTWNEKPVVDPTRRFFTSSGHMITLPIFDPDDTKYVVEITLENMPLVDLIALEAWEDTVVLISDTFSFTDFNSNTWTMSLLDQIEYETIRAKDARFSAKLIMFGTKN